MRYIVSFLLLLFFTDVAIAGEISGKVTVIGNLNLESNNTVVYLEGLTKTVQLPKKNPEILQRDQFFLPTVLAVQKGTTVNFPNQDNVFHSVFSYSLSNPFDFGPYGPGLGQSVKMEKKGIVEIFCDIHLHMYTYILVLDHNYYALTDNNGLYKITDVPPGEYTIKAFLDPDAIETKKVAVKAGNRVNMDFTLKIN